MPVPKSNCLTISYLTMRRILGILGIILPFILFIGGLIAGKAIQESISSYYYTNLRDVFIGITCGLALFLISYKGYGNFDDIIATICGACALGVTLFPTFTGSDQAVIVGTFQISDHISGVIHFICAGLFFGILAFISFFLFTKSNAKIMTGQKIVRNRIYRACGIIIVISIILIGIYEFFLKTSIISIIKPDLILESFTLWAFGVSWLIKGETLWKDK